MKKTIIVLVLLVIITTLYFYLYSIFTYDAVWNYGFAYNIVHGLVPYKDYNMIITPLFPYLLSIFILIFGHKLVLYYLLMAIIIALISYISYKKIGIKALFIFLVLLSVHDLGYNVLALLLFMFLLYVLDRDNDILIAVIISLMILTKQTLGLLIIPSIIYSKHKKKTILIYVVSFLILLLYLIINNSLFQFIDYCFLGMFDFTSNNSTKFNLVTVGEIIVFIILLVGLIKSKFKNKELFYILLFQIIVLPIVDGVHFIITFVPVLYYILYRINYKYFNFLIFLTIISFTVMYNFLHLNYSMDCIYKDKSSFLYGKRVQNYLYDYFSYIDKNRKKYDGYTLFMLDSRAYLYKLEKGIKINKYDLINNGNMGYKGGKKYIREIKDYCNNNKCLFFVSSEEYYNKNNQISREILSYVMNNYRRVSKETLDIIYVN